MASYKMVVQWVADHCGSKLSDGEAEFPEAVRMIADLWDVPANRVVAHAMDRRRVAARRQAAMIRAEEREEDRMMDARPAPSSTET